MNCVKPSLESNQLTAYDSFDGETHPVQWDSEEVRQLWRRYRHQNDPEARVQLIEVYRDLARWVYLQLAPKLPAHSEEDGLAVADWGLCVAFDRYDCERGVAFTTYATHWIRGWVMNYVFRVEKRNRSHNQHPLVSIEDTGLMPALDLLDPEEKGVLDQAAYEDVLSRCRKDLTPEEWVCFEVRFLNQEPYRVLQDRLNVTYWKARKLHSTVRDKLIGIVKEAGLL